jgi:mannitol 2-dehydrogenase
MFGSDDTQFIDWVMTEVKFPNSMVDRITPASTDAARQHVRDRYGYDDVSVVVCEPFRQWVLEDDFVNNERPAWDLLDSVTLVGKGEVGPYEQRKIRILNGGHASLCYPAALLDVEYVHEVMEHPVLSKFLDKLERTEICTTVPVVADESPESYWETTAQRFRNPTVEDTIRRNCYDGASRQPKFIVPVVADILKKTMTVDGLALVSALWCRYCEGMTDSGVVIEPNDPQWDRLHELAIKAKTENDPTVWLDGLQKDVYGVDVVQNPIFRQAFSMAWTRIHDDGVEAALKHYIEN